MTSTVDQSAFTPTESLGNTGRKRATRQSTSSRITLAVVCIATAMLMLDIAVVNTALTSIALDLHTDLPGVQWAVDAYTLPLAALVLTAGSLADRLGRRRILLAGLAVFSLGSLGCSAAGSAGLLVATRAVQGIGAAALFAVPLALLGHAFPDRNGRTAALAAFGATIGASFAIGPLVGGLLTEHAGWRWIFLINVPIGVLVAAVALRWVEESQDPHPRRIDWPGQTVLTAALLALITGLLRGDADGWTSALVLLCLGGGVSCLIAFLAIEHGSSHPMLPLPMFANRVFATTQVAAFAISSSLFAVLLYVSLYAQGVLGLSPVQTGAIYLPGTLLMIVVAASTSKLVGRVRPTVALAVSLLGVAAGLALLTLADEHSSWVATMPGIVLACGATGVFNPVMSGLVLQESAATQAGLATGINDTFRQTGVALGIATLGSFIPTASAFGGDPAGYVTGLHHALWAACAVAVVGAAVVGRSTPRRARVRAPGADR
ncbi:MFS transporter [Jatrophihabitans telluris]|uniref:MFS transporter n=1 Tax=Jatrophihabitans telluris TaxID=2038343 RepID=A0ABY4QW08_9ACTN|nr:MFS transporter [Jatrophihabitans telluris]UQX87452.1 MFS transporter [Jatrophihabitans telluris]